MNNETYAITKEKRTILCELIEKDGFPNQPALDMLQSLPLITEEPSELLRDICELEAADESDVYAVRVRVKDLELVLARHFQPLQDPVAFEALDELLGQYWDAAHKEGETGIPQSTEANDILHKMRQLVKPLQPITEADITEAMKEQFLKTPRYASSKDVFIAAVNAYLAAIAGEAT